MSTLLKNGRGIFGASKIVFELGVISNRQNLISFQMQIILQSWAGEKQIQYFLDMNANQVSELNIFFEEKQETSVMQPEVREQDCPESIPYLKKGDSNVYLDQFLVKPPDQPASPTPSSHHPSPREEAQSRSKDQDFELEQTGRFNPSAFHNFQKHLTVSLKHAIEVPEDRSGGDYQMAATKLWKHFKNSTVSTKKILHYLLGERNEHPITEAGLKEYGLLKIYENYGENTMREARAYLASETLRQIREGRLEVYISAKKLKDKDKFRRYVQIFVEELENGYLRKRLPKEKVAYLLRA